MYNNISLKPSHNSVIQWFRLDQFVPERSVTSYWISSNMFFMIRLILILYSTIIIWTDIGLNGGSFFQYFTSYTFIGLYAYLITSLVHHFRYIYTKDISFMINQPAILNYLYIYLYSTVVTFNILTPVLYWSLLNTPISNKLRMWVNVSVHGASCIIMMIDVIFNRTKLYIRTILFPIITVICYLLLSFLIYGVNHFWVYPFLNWNDGPKVVLMYFVVLFVCIGVFFLQVLIHWIRDRLAIKLGKDNRPEKVMSEC